MTQVVQGDVAADTADSSLSHWVGIITITLGLSGLAIFFEADRLLPGMPLGELLSYKLTNYSNILVLASTLVYLAHLWYRQSAVGKWASNLATASLVGLTVAILTRWYETYRVLEEGHVPISNLYEVVVFFTAMTVLVYLILESVYRTRAAGAFVMPIVVGAVGMQMWLVSIGQANPGELVPALKSYWMHAHVLANFIGYGAFAVGCGAGVMYLLRSRAERAGQEGGVIVSALPPLNVIDDWMYRSISIGFPVFTLATILGSAWAYYAWGGYWSWDPKETWALIVLLVYAAFLHARYVKGCGGVYMAWWAIAGFAVTLFCFLGVNLFLSGLHSYGNLS